MNEKSLLNEERIEGTIIAIVQDSFTVSDFIEVFKKAYPEDWRRLVERFGLFSSGRR